MERKHTWSAGGGEGNQCEQLELGQTRHKEQMLGAGQKAMRTIQFEQ